MLIVLDLPFMSRVTFGSSNSTILPVAFIASPATLTSRPTFLVQ